MRRLDVSDVSARAGAPLGLEARHTRRAPACPFELQAEHAAQRVAATPLVSSSSRATEVDRHVVDRHMENEAAEIDLAELAEFAERKSSQNEVKRILQGLLRAGADPTIQRPDGLRPYDMCSPTCAAVRHKKN